MPTNNNKTIGQGDAAQAASPTNGIEAFILGVACLCRTDTFAAYQTSGKQKYRRVDQEITHGAIRAHLSGSTPIACYGVIGDEVRTAVLDFDDHDKSLGWPEMVAAAKPVIEELKARGMHPLVCRSGGGAGIHVWLFWTTPQKAGDVQTYLKSLLPSQGLSHGDGGVQAGQVEVFPKNTRVKEGGYGNAVALPFARNSCPLDQNLNPVAIGDYVAPDLEELYSPPVPQVAKVPPPTDAQVGDENKQASQFSQLPRDEDEARAALRCIPSDDYGTWVRVAFALKHAFGADGFQLWKEWSAKSQKYPGEAEIWEVWDGLEPDGSLTIGTVFWMAQQNGWNGPSHPEIRQMNSQYAIFTSGKSTMIIEKDRDPDDIEVIRMIGKPVLYDRLASRRIQVTSVSGDTENIPIVPFWMKHPLAEHVHRLEFEPERKPGTQESKFNCWTGFAVKPEPGDWSLLQSHIYEVIADGDAELGDWFLNWMALGVQKPGLVIGTAPVLMGAVGVGKGVLANAYGHLWGRHFLTITHAKHVQGNFSGHFFGKRFVFVDEGIFGGDRSAAGVIKTRVTEPHLLMERKGIDAEHVRNHLIFMVASNEDSVVPADLGDRRWQVVKVSDAHQEDKPYFAAIARQLNQGGYEAMLYDLLRRDISAGPDPCKTIKTAATFEQALRAAGPELKYIYDILDEGVLPQMSAPGNGPGKTTIRALFDDMSKRDPRAKYISQSAFGQKFSRVFPTAKKVQSGTFMERVPGGFERHRSTRYELLDLATCRRQFEVYVQLPVPWTIHDLEWQEPDPDHAEDDCPF